MIRLLRGRGPTGADSIHNRTNREGIPSRRVGGALSLFVSFLEGEGIFYVLTQVKNGTEVRTDKHSARFVAHVLLCPQ